MEQWRVFTLCKKPFCLSYYHTMVSRAEQALLFQFYYIVYYTNVTYFWKNQLDINDSGRISSARIFDCVYPRMDVHIFLLGFDGCDGQGRVSGIPGVIHLTQGPGAPPRG